MRVNIPPDSSAIVTSTYWYTNMYMYTYLQLLLLLRNGLVQKSIRDVWISL